MFVATAASALAGLLPWQPAQAQSFCNGTVVADAFYRTVTSSGRNTSVINYWVQLQNRGAARHIRIAFSASEAGLSRGGGAVTVHSGNAPASSNDTAIGSLSQITVLLGTQFVSNSSGTGGLSATDTQSGLPRYTGVTCTTP
jgi:hypothetical protein